MKKISLLIPGILLALLTLENCKPDPPAAPPDSNDPDSLYMGTPYTLTKPFRFSNISNPEADSLTYEGIELGRRLFYDPHLSTTGQLSCASCHKPEFAFSDAGKAKSTNVFGPTKRNAPSIVNMVWANRVFWDGRSATLADQAKDAFHGEQDLNVPQAISYLQSDSDYVRLFKKAFGRPGDITEEHIYKAVQQFGLTLVSSESHFDRVQRGQEQFTESEARGFQIFLTERGDCFHCHTHGNDLLMTDNLFRNNGLDSAATIDDFPDKGRGEITGDVDDYGKFKTPTLRNVALTAPYMHDGRYQTLEQVINFYSDSIKLSPTVDAIMLKANHVNGGVHFSAQEKQDLLNFLYSMTDTSFTNNPAFQNPF